MGSSRSSLDSGHSRLFLLLGPSGVGKSTVRRYLERRVPADSAPKYTTRPSRGTEEDANDFIFSATFPASGILRFESYGHAFGIQLDRIDASFRNSRSHVTIVGDCHVAAELVSRYGTAVVSILVFCESSVLQARAFADPLSARPARWPQVRGEMAAIYDTLRCIQHVINNTGPLEATLGQVDLLLARL